MNPHEKLRKIAHLRNGNSNERRERCLGQDRLSGPLSLWERAGVRVRHSQLNAAQAQLPPKTLRSASEDTFPSPPNPSPEGRGVTTERLFRPS